MDNNTVALLQHIYSQLRNVYCIPAEVTYMKELKLLIEDMQRERCHTFDNGMNIPEEYKNSTDEERAEVYKQYKEACAKIATDDLESVVFVQQLYEEDYDNYS